MFTSVDKAVGALILAVISIMSLLGVFSSDLVTDEWVSGVVAALTPIIVYLLPNRK